MRKPVCAVVGVGPGNGAAIARHFSTKGYRVALMARKQNYLDQLATELGDSRGYACDVTDAAQVVAVFDAIEQEMGTVDVLVYNAGSGVFKTVEDTSLEDFELSWQVNTRGFLIAVQQVMPGMREHGSGVIIATGATASLRGNVQTAAFASAKAAQRSLAQSIAKHAGPLGIHVAYVILDGGVDSEKAREFIQGRPADGLLLPDAIAEAYYYLAQQHRSSWTFELDLRPYVEKW